MMKKPFEEMSDEEVTEWVTTRAAQYEARVLDLENELDVPDDELLALSAAAEHIEEDPATRPPGWDRFYTAVISEMHTRSGT